jgi:hypothetical protein
VDGAADRGRNASVVVGGESRSVLLFVESLAQRTFQSRRTSGQRPFHPTGRFNPGGGQDLRLPTDLRKVPEAEIRGLGFVLVIRRLLSKGGNEPEIPDAFFETPAFFGPDLGVEVLSVAALIEEIRKTLRLERFFFEGF